MRFARTAAAILATAALTGCSDSTAPATTDDAALAQLTADVAAAAGDAAAEDVQVFRLGLGALGLPTLDTDRLAAWSACPFDATAQRNVCAPSTRGPFTTTRSYRFAGADGTAQPQFGPTTVSANQRWTLAGDLARENARERISVAMARTRDVTLSGLDNRQVQVTIDGTGTQTRERSRFAVGAATERSYEMSASQRIVGVVVPTTGTDRWPTAGTITREFTSTWTGPNGTRTVTRTATITFDGSATATLVVNGRRFTVDLATGAVTPATAA
jgi:hypothetical protein